ncbi:hypothetical protein BpHYR1_014994 [Brachionus plicatilis]|uniref:Uncharacterized protein n=1 Tax=Brachionus plicatilis TaxID=10195 RepID=A0A3M7QWC3_BRAPC|nr:hypothetical protein BpHYR1_014994 [Brachionus plicatilis]
MLTYPRTTTTNLRSIINEIYSTSAIDLHSKIFKLIKKQFTIFILPRLVLSLWISTIDPILKKLYLIDHFFNQKSGLSDDASSLILESKVHLRKNMYGSA